MNTPLLLVGTFTAGFATCFAITDYNQFTAGGKLKLAQEYREEGEAEYKKISLASDKLDKARAKIYDALGIKEEDQPDLDTDDQTKVDNLTSELATKLIQQRDVKSPKRD
jgi:hypothetical protein